MTEGYFSALPCLAYRCMFVLLVSIYVASMVRRLLHDRSPAHVCLNICCSLLFSPTARRLGWSR